MMNDTEAMDDDELYAALAKSQGSRETAMDLEDDAHIRHFNNRIEEIETEMRRRGLN